MEARLTLLYGSVIAVQNELAELRQGTGAASYQIGEELEARSFFPPCFIIRYMLSYRKTSRSIHDSSS